MREQTSRPPLPARLTWATPFFLLPFLGGNHLSLHYVTVDRFWIETVFAASLVLGLCAAFLSHARLERGLGRFLACFLPFLAVVALSYLYTWNRFGTLSELNVLVWVPAAALLFCLAEEREGLLRALVAGSLACALCAIVQLKILFPYLLETFRNGAYGTLVREQVVPFAAFINQNLLGGYLAVVLPIALYFAASRRRVFDIAAASVILAVLLMSLSRLSLVIAGSSTLATGLVAAFTGRKRELFTVAACVACGVALFVVLVSGEKAYVEKQLEVKARSTAEQISTLDKRTAIWKNAYEAFRFRPLLGYGAGTFEYAYRNYFDGGLYTRYGHGAAPKFGVELGLMGLAAFSFFLLGLGASLWRLFHRSAHLSLCLAALSALLFAFVDFSFDVPAHLLTFFLFAAGCFAIASPKGPAIGARLLPLAISAVLLLSLGFTARANISKVLVEHGKIFEESGMMTDAYLSYRDAIDQMPLNTDAHSRIIQLLARSYENERNAQNRDATLRAAGMYARKAGAMRDRDAELLFSVGVADRLNGRIDAACALMAKAVSYFPSSAYYRAETASCLMESGDAERARSIVTGIQPYLGNLSASGNPQGLFVYRLREMEAELAFRSGDPSGALVLATKNLEDGRRGRYAITSGQARAYVEGPMLIAYLEERVRFYESAVRGVPDGGPRPRAVMDQRRSSVISDRLCPRRWANDTYYFGSKSMVLS